MRSRVNQKTPSNQRQSLDGHHCLGKQPLFFSGGAKQCPHCPGGRLIRAQGGVGTLSSSEGIEGDSFWGIHFGLWSTQGGGERERERERERGLNRGEDLIRPGSLHTSGIKRCLVK
ncbi:hypothetical protein DNTS_031860 [Danionella cerebrum]|uniref:Uncharacterized protein n=1 Tax=Danionella cerebrum TaxID=2873325 RepID=A0A553MT22_9TELE|nr:hypothetical protein DNTS_031860 [Danionella translucida]